MLSELREKNKQLKDQLQQLRTDSERLYDETECYLHGSKEMDSPLSVPKPSSSRRRYSEGQSSSAGSSHPPMLSDKAKVIRGEASKRIDGLLHDWRDYKDRADEEIRRRCRMEQNLRDIIARKEREADELSYELTSLRSFVAEQKKEMDRVNDEREEDAKCRARCVELELQLSKLNRYINELMGEIQVRDDLIRSGETERESLVQLNTELRQTNIDQRRKIEACEKDVTETRMELEILEEMVQALNDRKTVIFAGSARSSRPTTPTSTGRSASNRLFSTPKSPGIVPPSPAHSPISFGTTMPPYSMESVFEGSKPTEPVALTRGMSATRKAVSRPPSQAAVTAEDGRQIADRRSAMTALKSLQQEHSDKCNYLADHIQKLKNENKAKEQRISELQNKSQKNSTQQ